MPLTPQQQQQPVAQVSQLQQQQQPQPPPQQQPTQQQHMLPFATDTHAILATNTVQKKNIHQYIHRDNLYQGMLNLQHKRHVELSQEKKKEIEVASLERRARAQQGPTVVYGPGYRGYGNGTTGNITKIRYPRDKRRREEVLVPIRIELEHEHYKLRDTFTWNLNESSITPEQFAEIICEDLKLPANIFADQIAKSIKEQLDDFNLNASTTEDNTKQPQQPQQQELELRTVIKLDITVGNWELIDQFEWDIVCPRNSPEEFANKLVEELGLGGEFRTAIAHSIREQIHVYIKSLLLVGFEFNSSCPIDDELRHTFLPYLRHIIRRNNLIERFTPSMIELTDAAIDRMEKDRMREARRKRRGIPRARRGVLLPDREPQKTHRTGFATSLEQGLTDEQYLLNANESGTGHHKRSAALKARMNIAAEAANTGDDFIDNSSANTQGYISFSHGNRGSNAAVQLNRMYHHQQIR
ncbi:hypothetical protein BDF20DRAFT_940583 [Mycotypha africana]|uniref:uncharacterized protein n=1 Tax=Mycotypha africana TaxID=64632 RepID=UPI00230019D6|nr:uncharacterized protein BDF20DRAFT_940583 [Mycotypha africana]KAI8979657.1 hypothetical protein BDF20DRAFT_940583 [Mycotypha africana]